ncbi:MAG: 2-oxo acid dehydrogenase subunit E2 [Treponema sp.]|jgi:pyruvate dehydrogenase E2 component (dihydrolipoamide acetyltransferase)|nr:2-oxo acid dehydrogenase subunit E2 [Treponema sp.]
MAFVLIMPRQGNTVESCIINEWKVKEGDAVEADTPVCIVETDKAVFEVPAGEKGAVLKIVREAGDDVPVLEAIAVIGAAGEDWQAALGAAAPAGGAATAVVPEAAPAAAVAAAALEAPAGGASGGGSAAVSPRARNLAAGEGLSLAGIAGTGPGGRIIERDVAPVLQARPGLSAAAKAAAQAGGAVPATGSGLGGRVTAADMADGAVPAPVGGAATAAVPAPAASGEGAITDTPIKGIRKIISDRMLSSLASMAQFTLNASAPASRMQELRERIKAAPPESFIGAAGLSKVTVNDLILYAVSRVIPRFPFMNAHKIGDTLRTFERVHLGMAVDTPRGLMVPVIRNANLLSLAQISAEAKRLAASCQAGNIGPGEISGSTFTVTNLGSLGVSSFTPVINAPEVAILGVAGIELKPVKTKCCDDNCEGFGFEPHIGFSLTINHQVVDGAPAARFLKALGEAVAEIDLLLAV